MSHQIGRFAKFAPFSSHAFLGLFELCAYISEHFHQIQAISFSFSLPIRALSRALPTGNIKRSVAALRIALEEQRELFRERPIGSGHRLDTRMRAALRRLIASRSGSQ